MIAPRKYTVHIHKVNKNTNHDNSLEKYMILRLISVGDDDA